MFTGLMPRAAGLSRVNSPADVRGPITAHQNRFLPAVMSQAGYATGAASANLWLSKTTGFARALTSSTRSTRAATPSCISTRWREVALVAEALQARADDGASQVQVAFAVGRGFGERPFFWFVNLLECHSPYLPPRPYGG